MLYLHDQSKSILQTWNCNAGEGGGGVGDEHIIFPV